MSHTINAPKNAIIALFGGTFDPVHLGHINMAKQCTTAFNLDTLYFMPCALPAHKTAPGISSHHRIAMLTAAIAPFPKFKLDLRELKRKGPSYSLLSLKELREENPSAPILFLMGMDSFNNFNKWHQWQTISQLCHIVVYQRPGQTYCVNDELHHYVQHAHTQDKNLLKHNKSGWLYFLSGEQCSAASSSIRQQLKKSTEKCELLPNAVSHYITKHKLYQE